MPAILGPFESSLRGRGGCGGGEAGDQRARMVLHHSCSGASHGYGVKKERRTSDKVWRPPSERQGFECLA